MIKPMLGKTFGRWLVVSVSDKRGSDGVLWYNCKCDCGTERAVIGSMLRNGLSRSCGCLGAEKLKINMTKHGLYKHRLYATWLGMMQRCYNPKAENYRSYGERGIRVCERWHSVENFIADNDLISSPGLTIDRRDNDGDYTPTNCQWATRLTQQKNRRTSHFLEFNGKIQTCAEWARELGISKGCLNMRLKAYPIAIALSMAGRKSKHRLKPL